MNDIPSIDSFLSRVEEARRAGGVDLSVAEDLSLAVMNLVGLEEHFFFTAMKTGKDSYFDVAAEVRDMRARLLAELMPDHEGETWCASKHILSAAMRLFEVGNKFHKEGEKERAKQAYGDSYRLYAIFWALKTKLVGVKEIKKSSEGQERLEDLVTKLADCCKE